MTRRTRTIRLGLSCIGIPFGACYVLGMFGIQNNVLGFFLGFGGYLALEMVIGGRRVDHDLSDIDPERN
jgi:hypothetical protein